MAAGGAIVAVGAVGVAFFSSLGIGSGAFLGLSAKTAFAIGALAYNTTAFVVAPLLGGAMEGIDFDLNPTKITPPSESGRISTNKKSFYVNQ